MAYTMNRQRVCILTVLVTCIGIVKSKDTTTYREPLLYKRIFDAIGITTHPEKFTKTATPNVIPFPGGCLNNDEKEKIIFTIADNPDFKYGDKERYIATYCERQNQHAYFKYTNPNLIRNIATIIAGVSITTGALMILPTDEAKNFLQQCGLEDEDKQITVGKIITAGLFAISTYFFNKHCKNLDKKSLSDCAEQKNQNSKQNKFIQVQSV